MAVQVGVGERKTQDQQLEVLVTPHLHLHLKVVTAVLERMFQPGQLGEAVVTQHLEEMAQDLLQELAATEPLQVSLEAVLPTLVEEVAVFYQALALVLAVPAAVEQAVLTMVLMALTEPQIQAVAVAAVDMVPV
jgi:hypothetical protein